MTHPTTLDPRPYTVDIPPGFIRIPLAQLTFASLEQVSKQVAAALGRTEIDENIRLLAYVLSTTMAESADGELSYLGIGLFRSPDEDRPVLMVVSCANRRYGSDADRETVLAGLRRTLAAEDRGVVSELELDCGPAVTVVTEELGELTVHEEPIGVPVLRRAVTAWIPEPAGSTVATISVSSNNWQDWGNVCELALDLFNSLEWAWDQAGAQGR